MINKDYLYTEDWNNVESVTLIPDSLYLYAPDPESRSKYCAFHLAEKNPATRFVEVNINENDDMLVNDEDGSIVPLSSPKAIAKFFNSFQTKHIYIEVTGMSCRIAAPVLKYTVNNNFDVKVVYAEPETYKISEFRKKGLNNDLTEELGGVDPLPGLISLMPHSNVPIFVALLGFEGGRFSLLLGDQQPDDGSIFPILGVPGYRMDYPYLSIWGNRIPLQKTKSWQNFRYAEANSIVDAYFSLAKISFDNRNPEMIVAPIGTKPNAIGAILYAIKHPEKVELVYDNPKRSIHRTEGIGKVHVCDVAALYKEN